jgi:hypothetical protein
MVVCAVWLALRRSAVTSLGRIRYDPVPPRTRPDTDIETPDLFANAYPLTQPVMVLALLFFGHCWHNRPVFWDCFCWRCPCRHMRYLLAI